MMTNLGPCQLSIGRVPAKDTEAALNIIEEYYEAAGVIARDTKDDFARIYFCSGAGIWLAFLEDHIVGCIALRSLRAFPDSGEVKRLYVQPQHRGSGIAAALYQALELFARECGYQSLYLDTTDEMVAAQRFYSALGYKSAPRYNDNPQATIFMRKELQAPSR